MNDAFAPQRRPAWNLWGNPIFRRYCQSRLRPRGLGVSLLIIVLLAGFVTVLAYVGAVNYPNEAEVGHRVAFMVLGFLQLFILFVIGTAQVAGGMTAERDEGVIDYQRLVPMSPLAKVVGYLFGLPVREYVMFAATLPFSFWLIVHAHIKAETWVPIYAAAASSTLVYHLTGLVTGTVVKNRRWAFLVSIGLVILLYTVIPQLSKVGLVFFKYLSILPVLEEKAPGFLPREAGALIELSRRFVPTVKFFGLDFSELVFTVFSQAGLGLTFMVMLCRKWKRSESHLLGKLWATGFFIWIQVLFLGNALPVIDSGALFPTRSFLGRTRLSIAWEPQGWEAVALCTLYGLVTLLLLLVVSGMITPTPENQLRGWQRARKHGASSLPFRSDPATGFWFVLLMALAGAGGWFLFTRGLLESHWYAVSVPYSVLGVFAMVMLAAGMGCHAFLEAQGSRALGMATIFVGVVPVMVGCIFAVPGLRLAPVAVWCIGASPVSLPAYAIARLFPMIDLPKEMARAVPRAFDFWLLVFSLVAIWLIARLYAKRKAMAAEVLAPPPVEDAPPVES